MDLSWPHSPSISVNGCTPMDRYIGECKKMVLPTAADSIALIKDSGKGCYLYTCDIARAYRKLPLDPADWPFVCLQVQGHYCVDISLPFSLRLTAACCQDTTSFITCAFREQGGTALNYIDNFGGIAGDHDMATLHFHMLQTLLQHLGLKEAAHKASPPAQAMTWLDLRFDTIEMIVTI